MKKIIFILFLISFSVLFGCIQGGEDVSGTEPGRHDLETILLNYQPMQCEQFPWSEYKTGTVTTEEAVQIWLEKNGVLDASVDEISNGVVCEACDVCPYYYRYAVISDAKYESKLRELGFGELDE